VTAPPIERLEPLAADVFARLAAVTDDVPAALRAREVGTVQEVGQGVAWIRGLRRVAAEELLMLADGTLAMATDLEPGRIGATLLGGGGGLRAGDRALRTGRVTDIPVGPRLLGRVLDPAGRPLDGHGPVGATRRLPVERDAPAVFDRDPVETPLATGLTVLDTLLPIGRGQRELILGDRQTGKTTLAVEALANQRESGVVGVYCAIGQRASAVAKVVEDLKARGAFGQCVVVVAGGEDPPGLQFIAPYAATTIAESFVDRGRDVLIVYDDLTRHARAYRELSLLLRRPPGREAYPGDIFYIHARLLERAAHLRETLGGGSLTALPIVETQAQNLAAFIPTNLISITDGQIYLSPRLFQKGLLPAVDVGRSVSRVGGRAQLRAYRDVAGALRLVYAQYEELETFARFGTRLEPATRRTLERGRRVRELLKQRPFEPRTPLEQIAMLVPLVDGLFDTVPLPQVAEAAEAVRAAARRELVMVGERIARGEPLMAEDRNRILNTARRAIVPVTDAGSA
jgi:F-type H+-transporting ATPase subunit alpha